MLDSWSDGVQRTIGQRSSRTCSNGNRSRMSRLSTSSSKKYSGAGWGKTQKAAEKMALEKCGHERCKVHVSDCE